MTAATLHWHCLHCNAHGTTTGGDKGADAKHCAATGHGVTSHARVWAGDRRVAG